MRVHLADKLLATLREHARADFPNECCGLLVGTCNADIATITDVHKSRNLTSGDPSKSFEVDPKLRFDVMRDVQSKPDGIDVIGHYHSHPNGPAAPSATDLSMAYEPDMIWLILGVPDNQDIEVGAFQARSDRSAFDSLELVIESA